MDIPKKNSASTALVVGLAFVVVLVVAAVVLVIFVFPSSEPALMQSAKASTPTTRTVPAPSGSSSGQPKSSEGTGTAKPSEKSTDTVAPPAAPKEVKSIKSSFTFRNMFAPTVKPPVVVPASSTNPTSSTNPGNNSPGNNQGNNNNSNNNNSGSNNQGNNTKSIPANTLILQNIGGTTDGKPVAILLWNGETYEVAEGETLAGTPWRIVKIHGPSVDMLYGDALVTISVGQGITK